MRHYLRGLLQAETKNMERMEEVVPDADHQALQHMLSESAWAERAVFDQVAQDAQEATGPDVAGSALTRPEKAQSPPGRAGLGASGVPAAADAPASAAKRIRPAIIRIRGGPSSGAWRG